LIEIVPDAVENEEELYEDTSEWQDSSHDDARQGFGVDGLVGDLTGDLIGPHRVLNGLEWQERNMSLVFNLRKKLIPLIY